MDDGMGSLRNELRAAEMRAWGVLDEIKEEEEKSEVTMRSKRHNTTE